MSADIEEIIKLSISGFVLTFNEKKISHFSLMSAKVFILYANSVSISLNQSINQQQQQQ